MLEPLLAYRSYGSGSAAGFAAKGHAILRHSLLLSCSQDIANLSLDRDHRAPSISNIIAKLDDLLLRDQLREQFAVWRLPSTALGGDPDIAAALERIELAEESDRRDQFDALWSELQAGWASLSATPALKAFATIRDKLSAHVEVRYVADKYQLVDIASLGLRWEDLKATIASMQGLVELVGLLVRNANFAWDLLDDQLRDSASAFWDARFSAR